MIGYDEVFRIVETTPDGTTVPVGKLYRTEPVAKQQASRRRNSWRGQQGYLYRIEYLSGVWYPVTEAKQRSV